MVTLIRVRRIILSPWPEEKLKLKKPQNKYEWSFWIAVLLIIASKTAEYISVFKKSQISEVQFIVPLISLIGWTLLLVTIMRAGVQLVRTSSSTKRGRILIIVAGFLFLLQIAGSTVLIYTMSYMTWRGEAEEDIPKTLISPDLAPESREILGRSYAQLKYIQDGVIMDYVTATGVKEVYKPTDEDVLFRKRRVALFQAIRYEKVIMAYWCALFIATSAGLLRKKKAM